MSADLRIETVASLPAANRLAWDQLACGAFYSSHRWLSFLAQDPTAGTGFALAFDSGGVLVAGVPFARIHDEANSFYNLNDLLAERGLTPDVTDRLAIGPRRGYQTTVLTAATTHGHSRSVVAGLVNHLLEYARNTGLAGVAAPYADTATAQALTGAVPGATVLHLADDAWVDLPGNSFDDYLGSLSPHRRRRILRERGVFSKAGYEWTRTVLSEVADDAGRMLAATQERYGHPANATAIAKSLHAQGTALGSQSEVLILRRAMQNVGFISFYCHGDTLYLRAAGFHYKALAGAGEYFNLVYYLPIELCYERKLRRLHAGIEAADAKALRGARLHPLWLVDMALSQTGTAEQNVRAIRYNTNALRTRLASQSPTARAIARDAWRPFVEDVLS